MTMCPVEIDLKRYLDEQSRLDNFNEACDERQAEMTVEFLTGKDHQDDADELFCDLMNTPQFVAALQKVFKSHVAVIQPLRKVNANEALNLSVADLFKHCESVILPKFEKLSELEIANQKDEV